jgi:hypothetical protein
MILRLVLYFDGTWDRRSIERHAKAGDSSVTRGKTADPVYHPSNPGFPSRGHS